MIVGGAGRVEIGALESVAGFPPSEAPIVAGALEMRSDLGVTDWVSG